MRGALSISTYLVVAFDAQVHHLEAGHTGVRVQLDIICLYALFHHHLEGAAHKF